MTFYACIGIAVAGLVVGFVREWAGGRGVFASSNDDPYEMEIISYDATEV